MNTTDNSALIASAIALTNPELALTMDVEGSLAAWIKELGARVALYRRYERGDHRACITDQMRKMLRLEADDSGLTDFNDNYCQIVVDKMAGRLHITEVSLGADQAQIDKEWLSPLLQYNAWDALQGTTFRGAIRDGDSFIMIDPDTLAWTAEAAYDGYSGVFALFDKGSTPYWACKLWAEGSSNGDKETMCVVVYEPEKISYWRGTEGGSELRPDNIVSKEELKARRVSLSPDATAEPVNWRPWPVGNIPIVHFGNRYDNYSDFGESEMRAAVPLQDVLNRTLHSMVMASEFNAFNVLWSKGIPIESLAITPGAVVNLVLRDGDGKLIVEPTPEMVAFLAAVQVGQFTGTDISQYTNQIDKLVREISQVTQTPIYGITNTGGVSGEALKQLEIGLIGKCERFQRQNADAVRDLIKITAEIQTTFDTSYEGVPPPPPIASISVAWKSPEILDVSAQVTVLFNMRRDAPGLWDDSFYQARIGALLGMSQNDIQTEGAKARNTVRQNVADLTASGTGDIPPA